MQKRPAAVTAQRPGQRPQAPQSPAGYQLQYMPIPLPDDFAINFPDVYQQSDRPITRLHVHQCLEIGYCYSGSGIFVIEDKVLPFGAGDVSVINNAEMHLARSSPGTKSAWTFLTLDPVRLVGPNAPEPELLRIEALGGAGFPNILKAAEHGPVADIVREIIDELKQTRFGQRAAVRALVWTLMVKLQRIARRHGCTKKVGALASAIVSTRKSAIERVAPALELLAAQYQQPIYVAELARLCHTSVTNFRRWLHAATGLSPAQYLTRLRLQMAVTLLTSSTRSILDISLSVGYPTLSSFNRHFKTTLGVTPRDWRRGKLDKSKVAGRR